MSTPTLIQQTAATLYTQIKAEIGDIAAFADKPNTILFCNILTLATTAIEGLNSALSSAEKQSIAIEIGRLFIVDAKGVDSSEMNDYNILAVPMIEMLIGFSNKMHSFIKVVKSKLFSCFKQKLVYIFRINITYHPLLQKYLYYNACNILNLFSIFPLLFPTQYI